MRSNGRSTYLFLGVVDFDAWCLILSAYPYGYRNRYIDVDIPPDDGIRLYEDARIRLLVDYIY